MDLIKSTFSPTNFIDFDDDDIISRACTGDSQIIIRANVVEKRLREQDLFIKEIEYLELLKGCDYVMKSLCHDALTSIIYYPRMEIDLLAYLMKDDERLLGNEIQHYARCLQNAFSYCHSMHIIHADAKCENALIYGNDLILCDFARSLKTQHCKYIFKNSFVGTFPYACKEALKGKYSCYVDSWGLGLILFNMAEKQMPYDLEYSSRVMNNIPIESPIIYSDLWASYPSWLKDWTQSMLCWDLQDRQLPFDLKLEDEY